MKAKITFVLLLILPFLATACSCAWIQSFCETITPQSDVSTVKIIEKFTLSDSFLVRTYLVVESIEGLVGNAPKDTMTILAGFGSTCDANTYDVDAGDSLILSIIPPVDISGNIHYDSELYGVCVKSFLKIENGKVHDGISDRFDETIDYSDFKTNIVECSKLSILDDSDFLDQILFIYPNPANDILNVRLVFSTNYNYQIYDVSGRLISEDEIMDRRNKIDLSSLQKGVFFIKIFVNESFAIRKFVKL